MRCRPGRGRRAVRDRVRPAAAALAFLTAVPLGRRLEVDERDLGRSVPFFPAVGAFVGLLVAAVSWGVAQVLPPFPSAVLGVASGVAITAALHLDGLGDVADGIGAALSGREPADPMHDPRLGTFGVAAVALDLLLKVSVVSTLLVERFPWEIVGAGAIARLAPIVLASRLPYTGGGTSGWVGDLHPVRVAVPAAIALGVVVWTAGLAALGMVVVLALVTVLLGRWSGRHLEGVTGDVFGAAAELTETFSLAVAIGFLR